MVLKHGAKWLGKAVSAIGWITLLLDMADCESPTTLPRGRDDS
jgi:hypothetical protein